MGFFSDEDNEGKEEDDDDAVDKTTKAWFSVVCNNGSTVAFKEGIDGDLFSSGVVKSTKTREPLFLLSLLSLLFLVSGSSTRLPVCIFYFLFLFLFF